ncbi:MAG: hypothetical protein ACK58Q_13330 [Chitinophagales bacterium]
MEVDKLILYTDLKYRLGVAYKLVFFADEALKSGVYYLEFEKIKNLLDSENHDFLNKDNAKLLAYYALNYLFETVRITTFFENLLNAFLLINNKVVHFTIDSKTTYLVNKQKAMPINISEISDLSHLGTNTIGIAFLKKESYCNLLEFDFEFIEKLIPIFEYRNNVHFYTGVETDNLVEFIKLYEKILKLSKEKIDCTLNRISKLIIDLHH